MLGEEATNTNVYSLWFDPTVARIQYLTHTRRARKSLHNRCCIILWTFYWKGI